MRTTPFAAIFLVLALLAPAALAAAGGAERAEQGRAAAAARAAEREARAGEHEEAGRSGAIEEFLDGLRAIRASWHDNASAIRERCHAEMTEGEDGDRRSWAHCIRDGYKEWRVAHRDDVRALIAELHRSVRHAEH